MSAESILGFIAGVAVSILIVCVLTFFRRKIEHRVEIVERFVDGLAPRQGFIVEPRDERDILREEVIERNRAAGKDTKIEELL